LFDSTCPEGLGYLPIRPRESGEGIDLLETHVVGLLVGLEPVEQRVRLCQFTGFEVADFVDA
jgi:hypothetical protein